MNYFQELLKITSTGKSWFSKKRLEGSLAFTIGHIGMIVYLIMNICGMPMVDMAIWASIEFTIAGYNTYHIQKQKKEDKKETKA